MTRREELEALLDQEPVMPTVNPNFSSDYFEARFAREHASWCARVTALAALVATETAWSQTAAGKLGV